MVDIEMRTFIEGVSRLHMSGEIGCPDCGGLLGESKGMGERECLNCGEVWPLSKLDEWAADEAFDSQEALSRLIGDAREFLKNMEEEVEEVAPRAKMDNIDREERAGYALRAYPGYDPSEKGDIEEIFIDLITDLLHLARSLDIAPNYTLIMAQMHFDAEVEEDASEGQS